jgi:SAM-dependent methyltransferase
MDYLSYNRQAWDRQVARGNRWTIPVSPEAIEQARQGQIAIVLTPTKPVPIRWFGELRGKRVLCLASGGGQQVPILAAAGAEVTSYDNSPAQLDRDREVAVREGLSIQTVLGDMARLTEFQDAHFDVIFHPCSNTFVPEVKLVWRECFRVLKPGGRLLAGFTNPLLFLFDDREMEKGNLAVRHKIPYSDLASLTPEQRQCYIDADEPLCFGHTLADQIGGQLEAGFVLAGFYEDRREETSDQILSKYIDPYIATLAIKPTLGPCCSSFV